MSDAVDQAVASIDFRPLQRQKVFFDTQYIKDFKGIGFVNSDYVISSLRQQLIAAGCLLQEKPETADFIVEARVGALGEDSHDIVYGLPASNGLSAAATAASTLGQAPPIPAIPEIAMARKNDLSGAAKIAAFAYHRDSRKAVWQSGIAQARSTAKDTWWFGAGPFQQGSIYDGVKFAGADLPSTVPAEEGEDSMPAIVYDERFLFTDPKKLLTPPAPPEQQIQQASGERDDSAEKK